MTLESFGVGGQVRMRRRKNACVCVSCVLAVCLRQVVAFLFGTPDRHNSSTITVGHTKRRLIRLCRIYNRVLISTSCQVA